MTPKTRKSNALGPGTSNMSVNLDTEFHDEIRRLAAKSHMKVGQYVRGILYPYVKRKTFGEVKWTSEDDQPVTTP